MVASPQVPSALAARFGVTTDQLRECAAAAAASAERSEAATKLLNQTPSAVTAQQLGERLVARGWLDGSRLPEFAREYHAWISSDRTAMRGDSGTAPPIVALTEDQVPAEWKPGDELLGLYRVDAILGEGGMGKVYRVRHAVWDLDLAVKSPKPEIFAQATGKENFIREAETWVNLGIHPHVVSCHYVRTLGGIPRVFAEYVDGGSLSDAIRSRRLYVGDETACLAHLLDVAVQIAWGLHHAHEQGVVHQDVKPANVLLAPDGTAKVTDFGLARARRLAGESTVAAPGQSVMVSVGGMTPAYCSPEQAEGKILSRRTDVWSFGLTLLEMFAGELRWLSGVIARETLDRILAEPNDAMPLARIPDHVVLLLRRCFEADPERRWTSMMEIAAVLEDLYQVELARPYPRERPQGAGGRADALNNRAISLLDLGQEERAEAVLEDALRGQPGHPEATFNLALVRWRAGKRTDEEVLADLDAARARAPAAEPWASYRRLIEAERGEELAWRALAGTPAPALCVALSPDGRRVFAGCEDGSVLAWERTEPGAPRVFAGHTGPVRGLFPAAEASRLWSVGCDGTLREWDLESGRCAATIRIVRDVVRASRGADGALAVGLEDGTLLLLGPSGKGMERLWKARQKGVRALEVTTGKSRVLSAGFEPDVRIWEKTTGRRASALSGHGGPVNALDASPGGAVLLSGSGDGTVRVWDLDAGTCRKVLQGHEGAVRAVAWAGGRCLSTGEDGTLRVWDPATGRCLRTMATPGFELLAATADGLVAVAAGAACGVHCWSGPEESRRPAPLQLCRPRRTQETIRDEGYYQALLAEADDESAADRPQAAYERLRSALHLPGFERAPETIRRLADLSRRARCRGLLEVFERACPGAEGAPGPATVVPNGRFAAVVLADGSVRIWDHEKNATSVLFPPLRPDQVALAPDGSACAVAGAGEAVVFALPAGAALVRLEGHESAIAFLGFTPDGDVLVTRTTDGVVRLWDPRTGKCTRRIEVASVGRAPAAFSPDGQLLAMPEIDRVAVWDLAQESRLCAITAHLGLVSAVAFTPQGDRVLTGDRKGTVAISRADTGATLGTFVAGDSPVRALGCSGDGAWAVVVTEDGSVGAWNLADRVGRAVRAPAGRVSDAVLTGDATSAMVVRETGGASLLELDWDLDFSAPLARTAEKKPSTQRRPRRSFPLPFRVGGLLQALLQSSVILALGGGLCVSCWMETTLSGRCRAGSAGYLVLLAVVFGAAPLFRERNPFRLPLEGVAGTLLAYLALLTVRDPRMLGSNAMPGNLRALSTVLALALGVPIVRRLWESVESFSLQDPGFRESRYRRGVGGMAAAVLIGLILSTLGVTAPGVWWGYSILLVAFPALVALMGLLWALCIPELKLCFALSTVKGIRIAILLAVGLLIGCLVDAEVWRPAALENTEIKLGGFGWVGETALRVLLAGLAAALAGSFAAPAAAYGAEVRRRTDALVEGPEGMASEDDPVVLREVARILKSRGTAAVAALPFLAYAAGRKDLDSAVGKSLADALKGIVHAALSDPAYPKEAALHALEGLELPPSVRREDLLPEGPPDATRITK